MAAGDDEVCKFCGKTAQYFVRIELERLYDYPVCQLTWYLCEGCLERPQRFGFLRTDDQAQLSLPLSKQGSQTN